MFKRMTAVLAFAAAVALAPLPASAADALALKVLGFSADGRYFGFVQYGVQTDAGTNLAETFIIDTATDRFVPGVPIRVITEMSDDNLDEAAEIKALLAQSAKRTAGLVARTGLTRPGAMLGRDAEARTDEPHSGSGGPTAGAKTLNVKHPRLGELNLTLENREIAWPKTSKLGSHKEASLCSEAVDWQKGAGFRLTLARGGRTIVLNDDKTIPASRFCASGYGIAEVHAFDRPDGRVTLAVIVGMHARGFEGDDRLFLAVTRVLDR